MASPQKENGYIPIANELAEAFTRYRLSGQEWQVLWVILRKTYGWHKKEAEISLKEISEMTGIDRGKVCKIIHSLIEKNVIQRVLSKRSTGVVQKVNTSPVSYSLQKDYEKWKVLPKKSTVLSKRSTGVVQKVNKTVDQKVNTIKEKKEKIYIGGEKNSPPTYSVKKSKKDPYLLSFFGKVYLRKTEIQYHCSFKKDTELMKKLLKQFPARLVRKLIILYIYSASEFDIQAGLTIGLFYSKFNALHLEYKRRREKFEKLRKRRKWEKERQKLEEQEKEKQEEEFKQQWKKMSMLEKIRHIKRLERFNLPVPEWMKKGVNV
ncbi:replication protein [bacterium]|nr:replication protein [bacterium]